MRIADFVLSKKLGRHCATTCSNHVTNRAEDGDEGPNQIKSGKRGDSNEVRHEQAVHDIVERHEHLHDDGRGNIGIQPSETEVPRKSGIWHGLLHRLQGIAQCIPVQL